MGSGHLRTLTIFLWGSLFLLLMPGQSFASGKDSHATKVHSVESGGSTHVRCRYLSNGTDDWEPSLAIGGHHTVYIAATRHIGGIRRAVIWASSDNGKSFRPAVEPSDNQFDVDGSDTNVQSDSRGDVFASFMSWKLKPGNDEPKMDVGGLVLAISRNRGKSFDEQSVATPASGMKDKPVLAVSRDGRDIYITFMAKNTPDLVASHDSGKTWKRYTVDSRPNLYLATGIALSRNGDLYVANTPSKGPRTTKDLLAAVKSGNPLPFVLRIYKSSDKGTTWKYHDFASSTVKVGVCLHSSPCPVGGVYPVVAVDGRGEVYVAYVDGPYNKPRELKLIRSVDGGETWSAPQVISAAPRPMSNDQSTAYYPGIAAAGNGRVYITWVDDRAGPLNVWAKCSRNGGRTWSKAVRLSPMQGLRGYYGDYGGMGIDSNGTLHAVFGDGLKTALKAGSRQKSATNKPAGGLWYVTWDGR